MRQDMKSLKKVCFFFILICLSLPLLSRAQVGVVNGLTQEKICRPGDVFQGFISVRNYGTEAEEVRIYQTDYSFTFDGKSYYDPPGAVSRSNAAWITVDRKLFNIPGSSQVDIRYSVRVPDDLSLVGTYWSVIMVEAIPKKEVQSEVNEKKKTMLGVNQVMRYAVQIVTHIGDSGERSLKFLNVELLQEKDAKTFQVDVENVGTRWLRPSSFLELYNQKGELAGKYEGERLRLFPGTSVRFRFDVSEVKEGKLKALVVLDNRDAYVFGAQYTLDFSRAGHGEGRH